MMDQPSEEQPVLRDTTRNLVEAVWLDAWPRAGAIVDFGIDSQAHYEALYYGLREGEITPEALDAALGNGEKLTALARSAPSNPHGDITFSTPWDHGLPPPEAPGDGGQEADAAWVRGADRLTALFDEWRADYAARARENAGEPGWQVWHLAGYAEQRIAELMGVSEPIFPADFVHVADVPAISPQDAVRLTTSGGDSLQGTDQPWPKFPGVLSHVFAPRDTDAGDVLVEPAGQAYRVERDGFRPIDAAVSPALSPGDIADMPAQPDSGRNQGTGRERGG